MKIKTRTIWISVLISFILAVGLIVGVTQTKGAWTNVVIVLLAIDFIYMTIAIQFASTRTFRYRMKPKKYPQKKYVFDPSIENKLTAMGYQQRNTPYGQSYLKVDKEHAYKVVLVKNKEKYFNQEQQNNARPSSNKALEKCRKFIGFEIFLDWDEEVLRKLPDFCIQGENVYYAAFYYDQTVLICPNHEDAKEGLAPLFDALVGDLKMEEKSESSF